MRKLSLYKRLSLYYGSLEKVPPSKRELFSLQILDDIDKDWVMEEMARLRKMYADEIEIARKYGLLGKKAVIVGVDEAGRGPLAGPVVAGAVFFDKFYYLLGLGDSKKLSPKIREIIFRAIRTCANTSVGIAMPTEIDELNIHRASLVAMKRAVERIKIKPDLLIIDGKFTIDGLNVLQVPVIKGDGKLFSVSASSIIAKVIRDKIMDVWHKKYPQYHFDKNKGYGTKKHIQALKLHGASPIHRKSYIPVRKAMANPPKQEPLPL